MLTKQDIEVNDYCLFYNNFVCDDTEELLDKIYTNTREEDYDTLPVKCKQIKVYTKDRMKLPQNYIMEWIEDYLADNYGYDSYECGSIEDYLGKEMFIEFTNKVNKNIPWYILGEQVDTIDLSKEMKEYLEK